MTVLFGLSSAILYALDDLLAQKLTRLHGVVRVLCSVMAISTLIVVPLALGADGLPTTSAQWHGVMYAAAAGALYLGTWFTLLRALQIGDLSIVAPLSSLEGLLTALFAVANGQAFTSLLAVGIALASVGVLLAAAPGRAQSARGAGWALLTSALWSLAMICFNQAEDISWLSQAAWSRMTGFVLLVPIALVVLKRSRGIDQNRASALPSAGITIRLLAAYGGTAVLDLGGLAAMTLALAHGPLAVAGVTISQYATVAVILGLVFLRERPRPHQIAGVACALVAVGILGGVG